MLDLAHRLESSIINVFKELKEAFFKELKENIMTVFKNKT